jgi:hypothetical protein
MIRIDARDVGSELRATTVTDAKAVKSVVEMFREKYGTGDVKNAEPEPEQAKNNSHTLRVGCSDLAFNEGIQHRQKQEALLRQLQKLRIAGVLFLQLPQNRQR